MNQDLECLFWNVKFKYQIYFYSSNIQRHALVNKFTEERSGLNDLDQLRSITIGLHLGLIKDQQYYIGGYNKCEILIVAIINQFTPGFWWGLCGSSFQFSVLCFWWGLCGSSFLFSVLCFWWGLCGSSFQFSVLCFWWGLCGSSFQFSVLCFWWGLCGSSFQFSVLCCGLSSSCVVYAPNAFNVFRLSILDFPSVFSNVYLNMYINGFKENLKMHLLGAVALYMQVQNICTILQMENMKLYIIDNSLLYTCALYRLLFVLYGCPLRYRLHRINNTYHKKLH